MVDEVQDMVGGPDFMAEGDLDFVGEEEDVAVAGGGIAGSMVEEGLVLYEPRCAGFMAGEGLVQL